MKVSRQLEWMVLVTVGTAMTVVALLVSSPVVHATLRSSNMVQSGSVQAASKGIFNSDQAERGEKTYLDECARCHERSLTGGDFGPALIGTEFMTTWNSKTVGMLYSRIRRTMPVDSPGRLSDQQAVDLTAYILKNNDFPTGDAALDSSPAALNGITIDTPNPQR